ncbi:hypothetical protein [Actinomadura sp. 6N118]|uniref:hypothetical protein n=1 Tax=Actinomadura sp. 6N118 TaxID=3375151 RepID=UPI0037AA8D1C
MPITSMEVMVRRLFTLLVVLVVASVAMPPAPASAEDLTVYPVSRYEYYGWSSPLTVSVASGHDVTQVKVWITPAGATQPVTYVDDFALYSGTARQGAWRSAKPVELPWGRADATVEAQDASGAKVTKRFPGGIHTWAETHFSEFTVTPNPLSVDHGPLTFRGRLIYKDREGDERPVAGVPVVFKSDGIVRTKTTGADGEFSGSVFKRRSGQVTMTFDGTADHYLAEYAARTVTVAHAETRLRAALDWKPTVVGQPIIVTGTLERKSSTGEWVPLVGGHVQLRDGSGQKLITAQYTPRKGTFHLKARAQAKMVLVYEPYGESFVPTRLNLPDEGAFALRYRPRLTNLAVTPRPVGHGARLNVRGRVLRQGVDGSAEIAPGARVEAQFSTDKRTWRTRSAGTADAKGDFKLAPVADRDGYWRVIVDDPHRYLPGPSAPTFVDVRHRTAFTSFNASPEPVKKGRTLTISGKLNRHVGSWRPGPGAKVYVYFKANGTSQWIRMAVVKTGRDGSFRKGFKASRDGTWQAAYKGGTAYLGVWSTTDHVDVR